MPLPPEVVHEFPQPARDRLSTEALRRAVNPEQRTCLMRRRASDHPSRYGSAPIRLRDLTLGEGRAILTACDDDELAEEPPSLGHDAFTHALLAPLSQTEDMPESTIGLGDLYEQVRRQVVGSTDGRQQPVLNGRVVGARLPRFPGQVLTAEWSTKEIGLDHRSGAEQQLPQMIDRGAPARYIKEASVHRSGDKDEDTAASRTVAKISEAWQQRLHAKQQRLAKQAAKERERQARA